MHRLFKFESHIEWPDMAGSTRSGWCSKAAIADIPGSMNDGIRALSQTQTIGQPEPFNLLTCQAGQQ